MLASLLLAAAAAQDPSAGERPPPPRMTIGRIDAADAPRIDGDLTDPVWRTAPKLGPLTMVEPTEGAEPSQRTEVWLTHDRDYFYMAFVCHETEPGAIRAVTRQRDARADPDDRVEWVIDTFQQGNQGYFFQLTAGGSRGDSLLGIDSFTKSWDTIWDGRTRVTPEGWQGEVRIPFRSLAFPEEVKSWGFNLRRGRRVSNEEFRWASPYQNQRFFRLGQLGVLEGFGEIEMGNGIDAVPFALYRQSRRRLDGVDWADDPDAGGEIYWRITPALTAAFTLFTDFAETENDGRQINLTRFPLFFPELRDFFLQDESRFSFGPGGFGGSRFRPFFSRRIGIGPEGNVPILAGVKVAGQAGPWEIGFLDVLTEEGGGVESDKNLGVLRLNYSLAEETRLGVIGTRGRPTETGQNSVQGLDFYHRDPNFLGSQELRVWAFGAASTTSGPGGEGNIWSARAEGRGREWEWSANTQWSTEEFNPELGFLRRRGVKEFSERVEYGPRLNNDVVRRLIFQLENNTVVTEGNTLADLQFEATPFGFELQNEDRFTVDIERNFERLFEPFDIFDGITVPAGDYWQTRVGANLRTNEGRPINVQVNTSIGDLFNGESWRLSTEMRWRASPFLSIGGRYNQTKARFPGGRDFLAFVSEANLDLQFSPDLSVLNLVQFDNDSSVLGLQSRLRWITTPGSNLFVVLGLNWQRGEDDIIRPDQQVFTVKFSHTLRF